MAVDQLADLLVRWREAGGVFSRGRVLTEGIRLLGGLDADERRVLARALAAQGAPKLADRVEERTGGAVDAEQMSRITEGLLALDDRQIDHLVASLRAPSELGDQPLGSQDLGETDLLELGIHEIDLGAADTVEPTASEPAPAAPTPPREEPLPHDQPDLATVTPLDDPPAPDASSGAALVVVDGPGDPVGREKATAGAAALLARLRAAGTATQRLRMLDPRELGGLEASAALALLDAVPDGWQRRRAAERLVDAGTLPTGDLPAVLARFARASDAVFVAGALVASGQLAAHAFDGLLSERAIRRLSIRGGR